MGIPDDVWGPMLLGMSLAVVTDIAWNMVRDIYHWCKAPHIPAQRDLADSGR